MKTYSAFASVLFTITVADVDAVCAALATRGFALLNGPIDRFWGMRAAIFADPDGYLWELVQEKPISDSASAD